MKDLTKWKNEQFETMKADMEGLLRDFFRDFGAPVFDRLEGEGPFLEISEDDEMVLIRLELPDLDPGDLEISVSRESLVIRGRQRHKMNHRGKLIESHRGFSNRLRLPYPVIPDTVTAVIQNHHLEIRLPKCRGEVFKKIPVRRVKK